MEALGRPASSLGPVSCRKSRQQTTGDQPASGLQLAVISRAGMPLARMPVEALEEHSARSWVNGKRWPTDWSRSGRLPPPQPWPRHATVLGNGGAAAGVNAALPPLRALWPGRMAVRGGLQLEQRLAGARCAGRRHGIQQQVAAGSGGDTNALQRQTEPCLCDQPPAPGDQGGPKLYKRAAAAGARAASRQRLNPTTHLEQSTATTFPEQHADQPTTCWPWRRTIGGAAGSRRCADQRSPKAPWPPKATGDAAALEARTPRACGAVGPQPSAKRLDQPHRPAAGSLGSTAQECLRGINPKISKPLQAKQGPAGRPDLAAHFSGPRQPRVACDVPMTQFAADSRAGPGTVRHCGGEWVWGSGPRRALSPASRQGQPPMSESSYPPSFPIPAASLTARRRLPAVEGHRADDFREGEMTW